MADCSYARCVQERRAIKKELQRWTKNMIFIVGLERIAEEFMGRRKWKHYQETILRSKPQAFVEPENKDWGEEDDKCCFCDGGMFLGQATSPPSDCSGSSSNSRSSFRESPLTDLPASSPPTATMATLDSVSSLASISSLASVTGYVKHSQVATTALPGLPMFPLSSQQQTPAVLFPPWYLSTSGPTPPDMKVESDTPPAVISLPASSAASTEQPLDLSAKAKEEALNSSRSPTPQSLRLAGLSVDSKNILKAKPRMSAVAGRRTYTEEELQAALRDIQSGKLGTRRAAVIYGIPRSTLRNKVYKLAMERERDAHLVVPVVEDKELSGAEEEKEVERTLRRPLLSVDDLMRVSMLDGDALRSVLEEAAVGRGGEVGESPVFSRTNELWQGLEHSALGPYISQLLAAGGVNSELSRTEGGDGVAKIPFPLLPELVRRMMTDEQHHLAKFSSGGRQDVVLNGISNSESKKSSDKEVTEMAARLAASTSQVKAAKLVGRAAESEECTDTETAASTSRVATPPNVILKIPSYKPTTKNGVATPGCESVPSGEGLFQTVGGPAFPGQESSQVFSSGSESQSPPITNLVGKGIAVSLRDVIAKSISQKFQQQGDLPLSQKLLSSSDEPPLKRGRLTPPIGASLSPSVIKQNNNNNSNVDDRNKTTGSTCSGKTGANSAATSGKGTRPKRGKYRNYDRDSLVEAVRAVQRGEMSVHRAGSYYGVPHSTLEYKVKERHLMRPRKREPKQQHTDDSKLKDEPGNSTRNASVPITVNDKLKVLHKPPKAPFTPTTPLPGAPNGLKITPPLFDPSLSPLAAYTGVPPPFPFWASPFHALPVPDFGASASGSFPANPEHFFASQMMHKLQEESRSVQRIRSPPLAVPALGKTAREMAESLYDGTGTNGNFLDGIIRSSLEMGLPSSSPKEGSTGVGNSGKMSNKALIDQLCRNSCLTPLPKADITINPKSSGTSVSNSDEESGKQECAGIKTSESDVILPPAVDLSQSFSGPECENHLVSNQDDSVAKDMDGETATEQNIHVALSDEDSKLCEESSSVHNLHAINTVDESACDSKTVSNRTGDIEAAKDLLPTEEGNENIGVKLETKLKMDNSQRD